MFGTGRRYRFAATVWAIALVVGACSSAATQTPSTQSSAAAGRTGSAADTGPGAIPAPGGARLVVLARGSGGGMQLWLHEASADWSAIDTTTNPSAVARTADGIAVASGAGVDMRSADALSKPGTATKLVWPGRAASASTVAIDVSPGGKVAVVAANGDSSVYGVAGSDGTVTSLIPAPTQPFTPLVAWLDESRLIVLSTDPQQVSRLTVINPTTHAAVASTSVAGVREFAVSLDRQTVAAATGSAVYVGPTGSLLGGGAPAPTVTLGDAEVVWALALNGNGSQVFMLSGTVAGDGTVGSVHELGYTRQGGSWVKTVDTPVPFGQAVAQVCLS
jgi:hypothetical protein